MSFQRSVTEMCAAAVTILVVFLVDYTIDCLSLIKEGLNGGRYIHGWLFPITDMNEAKTLL